VRLPAAVVLVAWGARTDRRWVVPVGVLLALPAVWFGSAALLLAVIPLRERDDAQPTLPRPGASERRRVPGSGRPTDGAGPSRRPAPGIALADLAVRRAPTA
jgi:hypothetical protein